MLRLLFLFLAVVAAVVFVHWLIKEDPKKVARYLRRGALWAAVVAVVLLAVTGRLHWLFAVFASLVPFFTRALSLLRFVPILSHLYTQVQNARAAKAGVAGSAGGSSGHVSQVESRFVRMTLDHDSGAMDGEVLTGDFAGRYLSTMSLAELLQLFKECRAEDQESAALLQAYLDRVHGEAWHEQAGAGKTDGGAISGGAMSVQEAREILGVGEDATRDDIVAAHRRLMQKLHPDRGGSTYLAAKINQAKDLLLDE